MTFTIECEAEDDGPWIAEVIELPGVLMYGATAEETARNAEALAQSVLTERLEDRPGNAILPVIPET
jgi:predicted RNase H-like HicB family nuclease